MKKPEKKDLHHFKQKKWVPCCKADDDIRLWLVSILMICGTFGVKAPAQNSASKPVFPLPATIPEVDPHKEIKISGTQGLTPMLAQNWEKISLRAEGSEVRWAIGHENPETLLWLDQYVAREVSRLFKIRLVRQATENSNETMQRLLREKKSGLRRGTTDLISLQGDSFERAKIEALLYGPLTSILPSFTKYFDPKRLAYLYDRGVPVDNLAAPLGFEQFVFVYHSERLKDPPQSLSALKDWIKKNPGKFAFPPPSNQLGRAFLHQLFYGLTGGHEQYFVLGGHKKIAENMPVLWTYLGELKPFLWHQGKAFPESEQKLDELFATGEILMNFGFAPSFSGRTLLMREVKDFKCLLPHQKNLRCLTMKEGFLTKSKSLAIPFNAPNTDGALVVIDFLLSPEAQGSRLNARFGGLAPAIEVDRLNSKDLAAFRKAFSEDKSNSLRHFATEKLGETKTAFLELPPEALKNLELDWEKFIESTSLVR